MSGSLVPTHSAINTDWCCNHPNYGSTSSTNFPRLGSCLTCVKWDACKNKNSDLGLCTIGTLYNLPTIRASLHNQPIGTLPTDVLVYPCLYLHWTWYKHNDRPPIFLSDQPLAVTSMGSPTVYLPTWCCTFLYATRTR